MRARQSGMSLVVAIFVITVVASLAAFAVTIGTAHRETGNLGVLAERALLAARAGTEWAARRALVNNSCVASSVLNLNQGALRGFRVTVNCSVSAHIEGATNYNVYDVTSFAQLGNFGAAGYVSRTVQARFDNGP